ncbi:MAG TPA: DUF5067 domain-containing protein [Candidatus Enterenecus stercoripullorum]|nr:DUF5067 domain-containing protein [Candidatus Enterenecus stercoripullorum]
MKKIFALSLALCMALALCACSGGSEPSQGPVTNAPASEDPVESETPEESEAPVESEPTAQNAADVGDYHVEIKSAALAEDYEGNPALIVTYSWTNNSEDTTSAMVAVSCSAFQDGVSLDTAIIANSDIYDSDSFMTEVRPGTTIDVQAAFVLGNTESPVEVEVGEWLTFDSDPPMAYMEFDLASLA